MSFHNKPTPNCFRMPHLNLIMIQHNRRRFPNMGRMWEHALLNRFGLPRQALLQHHARLRIEPIVQQLEQIDHPNIALTLDFAHLWIAANDLDSDYLASVKAAARWVKHLHLSDNFGRLDHGFNHELDRWA